jgi:hypothetical protein
MGGKLKSKTHLQNTFFDFLGRFLHVLLQSFKKVLRWPKKLFFWPKSKKIPKKRRISRWIWIRLKSCKKLHQKEVIGKTSLTNMSKREKGHISVTFLLITFFRCIFSKLFQRIQNQREILRFFIPKLNFLIKKFFMLLWALSVNFDCTCAGNSSKKRKIFFYECVLEFY